jgi:two-component system, cell cycle sensor histidine kinase and response regulator CckA
LTATSETSNDDVYPPASGQEDGLTHEPLHLAARAAQDLVWDWDLAGGTIVWAGTTRPYFGVSPHGMAGLPGDPRHRWAERVHPDDLARTQATSRAALESGADSWEHEYRFRRADGSYASVLEHAVIARDPQGRPVRVVGAMRDVLPRKEIERTTTRLAAIVATSADAIISKTVDGVVTSWNTAAERIFGYTEQEMVGQSIFVLVPEELHDSERDLLQRIRRGERVDFADTERIRKDGTRINIALTVAPIWDSSGGVVGASSIKRDITDRKRAEAELTRREERYRALVMATSSIVWTANADGQFDTGQASWEQFTGQPLNEPQGYGWINAVHPDDRESVRSSWIEARDQRAVWESSGRLWSHVHQEYRHFLARAVPVLGPDDKVREWIGTVTDTEDRWLAEERLRQADRMESVGRLAGGVAHEANNQMTVILGAAEFLNRAIRDGALRADLDHIRRAAHRTAAITQQLLAFSRRQLLQPQVMDLNAVVTAIEPILQRALGEVSQVKLRLSPDLGQIHADPGQLDQVLLNLALNARDAMPDGGTLTIETVNVVVDENRTVGRSLESVIPGSYAALIVSDSGEGMDPETLAHIFEPFFTTKAVGEGTGLGLATVYGIVKQTGGFITVSSEPGQGSSFRIYLPLVSMAREAEKTPPERLPGGGSENILVVEDEPAVCAIVARTLRVYGYTVIEGRDGTHAMELAQAAAAPPDLVIADVVMPRMGGKRLAEEIEKRWPGTPVLFTSGYAGLEAVRRGLLDEGRDFVQKPLDPDMLVQKVRRMLDAAAADRSGSTGALPLVDLAQGVDRIRV